MRVMTWRYLLAHLAVLGVLMHAPQQCAGQTAVSENATLPGTITFCTFIQGPWVVQIDKGRIFNWPQPEPGISLVTDSDFYSNYEGFIVDLIRNVVRERLKWNVRILIFSSGNPNEIIYRVRAGTCHQAITSFFMDKSRAACTTSCPVPDQTKLLQAKDESAFGPYGCCLDFSQPILGGGFAFIAKIDNVVSSSAIKVVSSPRFIEAFSWLIIGLFIVAHGMFLFERRPPSQKDDGSAYPTFVRWKYLDGITDTIWYSAFAVTTAGLGSRAPSTQFGRLLGVIWIFMGLFMFTYFTGLFSAALVEDLTPQNSIQSIDDIQGKRICVKLGFFDGWWNTSRFKSLTNKAVFVSNTECYAKLVNGEVDAMMQNFQSLAYNVIHGNFSQYVVTPIFAPIDYGALWSQAVPSTGMIAGSTITPTQLANMKTVFNSELIDWKFDFSQESTFIASTSKWFNGDGSTMLRISTVDTAGEYKWSVIIAALVLMFTFIILTAVVTILKGYLKRSASMNPDGSAGHSAMARRSMRAMSFIRAVSEVDPHHNAAMSPDNRGSMNFKSGAKSFGVRSCNQVAAADAPGPDISAPPPIAVKANVDRASMQRSEPSSTIKVGNIAPADIAAKHEHDDHDHVDQVTPFDPSAAAADATIMMVNNKPGEQQMTSNAAWQKE